MLRSLGRLALCVALASLSALALISAPPFQAQLGLSNSGPVYPLSMPVAELSDLLGGTGKAKLFWSMVREGIDPLGQESELSDRAKRNLLSTFGTGTSSDLFPYTIMPTGVALETVSSCGGRKQLHSMRDGLQVESVIIPHGELPRVTLCVSSQVGCDRGCVFCATGKMGLVRNLTPDEILSQVFWAKLAVRRHGLQPLRNIVFMGMGDAGRNLPAVSLAAAALVDHQRFGIAASKVTLSTVGPTPEVFSELAQIPGTIAWSLHSALPELRQKLVPSSRYHDPSALREGLISAMLAHKSPKHRSVMVAVTLLRGVNSARGDAEALAAFLGPVREQGIKVSVDLIPYNDIGMEDLTRPTDEEITAYKDVLYRAGFQHSVRLTRGQEDASACGMLATSRRPQTVA